MAQLAIPFTMLGTAAGASAATATATGLMLAGTGLGVAGQIQAGRAAETEAKSAQAMANYNAAVQEREAKAIEQRTAIEQQRQAEESARAMSAMRARIGIAGAVPTVGAPLMVQAKQASEFELENLMIGYRGMTEAARARSAAEMERMGGRLARERGRARKRAAYIGAGATLLTGFGAMGMYGKPTVKKPTVRQVAGRAQRWIGEPQLFP